MVRRCRRIGREAGRRCRSRCRRQRVRAKQARLSRCSSLVGQANSTHTYTRASGSGNMEIVPGLHAVRLLGSKGYLVVDHELTLIDAGLRGSTPLLRWYLSRIGRQLSEITRIVCTHGHPDHIGGVHEIAALTGAEVLMHPADTARLRETRLRDVMPRADRAPRPVAGQLVAAFTRAPADPRPL